MSAIDALVEVMRDCPHVPTRERLSEVVRKLRAEAPVRKAPPVRDRRVDLESYAAGKAARAAGRGKNQSCGSLRGRNAWLAGWNDEDIKRGGR